MRDFNILSPGKKILAIRKDFKIKQEDITGGDITRNLISIIENDKANLTAPVAKILAYNINKICKERNLDFSVTEEGLLESVVVQAKKIADEYIEYINPITANTIPLLEQILPEIDVFLKTYETEEKKSIIYKIIASKYAEALNFQNAYIYYLRAYESCVDCDLTFDILFRLASCAKRLCKYEEAIKFYNTAITLNSSMNFEQKFDFYFNKAVCHSKLNRYDLALELLEEFSPSFDSLAADFPQKYIDYLILNGNCLKETNNFNKAINIYKSILKSTSKDDLHSKLLVFIKLCSVYEALNDYSNLRKNSSRALAIINDPEYVTNNDVYVYFSIGHTLKCLNDLSKGEEFLFKALAALKDSKNSHYYELGDKIFLDLIDIFKIHDNYEMMGYLKNEFFEMISIGVFDRYHPLVLNFVQYYNSRSNYEDIDNLLHYCLSN